MWPHGKNFLSVFECNDNVLQRVTRGEFYCSCRGLMARWRNWSLCGCGLQVEKLMARRLSSQVEKLGARSD